jgi:mRNA deadenylase 3'-5' endonuclease subunit Ccr4
MALRHLKEIQMDDLTEYMGSESSRANMRRSNVALVAVMEYLDSEDHQEGASKPENMFVASTAHIYWNPERPEVKNLQSQYLVGRVEKFVSDCNLPSSTPIIITGDFNSVPYSDVYSALTHGFHYLSENGKLELPGSKGPYYGPGTKFLCDKNLR